MTIESVRIIEHVMSRSLAVLTINLNTMNPIDQEIAKPWPWIPYWSQLIRVIRVNHMTGAKVIGM